VIIVHLINNSIGNTDDNAAGRREWSYEFREALHAPDVQTVNNFIIL